ncbi:rhodanese-like domain-containing protein [Alteromonas aestuariivivens]|uniref:Rhodanese-like domain-containing protein n=1 Tax=Alteromonas aestuariivivens TaxID=1938339 RepID=A0A3D8MEF1_9ALTE|nr:rhodanese-like domain-containing protein [Alteromonas aestuariivivens]RDV28980.1 rhodanese-like domain-containing protein [Alteromonas aestuariivivens]
MKHQTLIIAVVLTLLLLPALYNRAETTPPGTVQASAELLDKVSQQDWLLIDVRSAEEFAEGHIPGAINMPYDKIGEYVSSLRAYQNKPVVLYCRSGRRARLAMEVLAEHQFNDLRHLEGDMMGWYEAGLPIDQM